MAGLNTKRNSGGCSWEYYIASNDKYLLEPLPAEKDGTLYSDDLTTALWDFNKYDDIQILSSALIYKGNSRFQLTVVQGITGYVRITCISKPSTAERRLTCGQRMQERQEIQFINIINRYAPVKLKTNNEDIFVLKAYKNAGLNEENKEKYADVVLETQNKTLGISLKMDETPSLFGGGRKAMYDADPVYFQNLMDKAFNAAISSNKFKLGTNKLTDIYIPLTDKEYVLNSLRGTQEIGGPVHFIGTGQSKLEYTYKNGTLYFDNLTLLSIEQYQESIGKPYVRIRRRCASHVFVDKLDEYGLPYIFGSLDQDNDRVKARVVVTDKPSKSALILSD